MSTTPSEPRAGDTARVEHRSPTGATVQRIRIDAVEQVGARTTITYRTAEFERKPGHVSGGTFVHPPSPGTPEDVGTRLTAVILRGVGSTGDVR